MNNQDLKEFESFLVGNIAPPPEIERQLITRIRKELNPSIPKAIAKLFALNAVGSVATLALCPQYGLSLTGTMGLMPFFMQISPALCFLVCGLLWMGGGQVLANFFITWDERRALSRYYWGAGFSFILFSILAFACFGSLTFDLWLLLWVAGALVVVTAFDFKSRSRMNRIGIAGIGRHV